VLDGRAVAIKVLRPGLASAVRQDLMLLEGLLAPLNAAFPALDAGALLREVRERTLDELDLESEAETLRRFHRALRRHPLFGVPAPVMRLAHENVLVSEWVEGVPLWEAPDPDEAAARLVVFGIGAARFGRIHAELTPDDVLVLADGRLAVIDFGASSSLSAERAELLSDAVEAFASDDAAAFGAALASLGALDAGRAPVALSLARDALGELATPGTSRLDSAEVSAARDRLLAREDLLSELIAAGRLPPEDVWPARGVGQLFATVARVGATADWLELVRGALREGWDFRLSAT
jgi:predicted unusual protein kinase regulating ubiquinone biosynthesis (AarF/ABC1/UbiB family)